MNINKFAQELQEQCEELEYLRIENMKLRKELSKYQDDVREEFDFWSNTYGDILTKLVEK